MEKQSNILSLLIASYLVIYATLSLFILVYDSDLHLLAEYDIPETLYKKGVLARKNGDGDQALKYFTKATQLAPDNPKHWSKKAHSAMYLEKQIMALEAFEKVIELDPMDEEAWSGKIHVLVDQGQHQEVVDAVDEVVKLKPWARSGCCVDFLSSYTSTKINSLIKLNKYNDALESTNILTRSFSGSVRSNGWKLKVDILTKLNRHDEAKEAEKIYNTYKGKMFLL